MVSTCMLGCMQGGGGLLPERRHLPRRDHEVTPPRVARRVAADGLGSDAWVTGRDRGAHKVASRDSDVACVELLVCQEVVVVVGAPRARLGRPVAVVGEQDARAQLARREARPLVVEHHPDMVTPVGRVPKREGASHILERRLEHQRALVRSPTVLALFAPVVRLVIEVSDRPHEEGRMVDGHEEQMRFVSRLGAQR